MGECLGVITEMGAAVGVGAILRAHFILDIDLNYFRTSAAIHPADWETFYSLVRKVHAITIAPEPECVEDARLDGKAITSALLLPLLMNIIHEALA